jgi:hypothetical protein
MQTLDLSDQDLLQKLLDIAKLDQESTAPQRHSPRLDTALCTHLLEVCASRSGVIRALALNILNHWAACSTARVHICVQLGAVSILLDVLTASLLAPVADPSSREAASLAVMALKRLIKDATAATATALVAAHGVSRVLDLAAQLQNHRALGLTLYLLNDITRRCPQALDGALQATGVILIVQLLG